MFLRELCRLCCHFLGAEEEGKSGAVGLGQCAVAVLMPDSGEPSVKSESQLTEGQCFFLLQAHTLTSLCWLFGPVSFPLH